MGCMTSRGRTTRGGVELRQDELKKLVERSHFTEDEIMGLHENFIRIAQSVNDDNLMDKEEFLLAIGQESSHFLTQVFSYFNTKKDGFISFNEYVNALSTLSERASFAEKTECLFRVYDEDDNGYITETELRRMLLSALEDKDLNLSEEEVVTIVRQTFIDAGSESIPPSQGPRTPARTPITRTPTKDPSRGLSPGSGEGDELSISFEQFIHMVSTRPAMLSSVTIQAPVKRWSSF